MSEVVRVNLNEVEKVKSSLGVPCIICGEIVELDEHEVIRLEHGLSIESKVCNDCSTAVKKLKSFLDMPSVEFVDPRMNPATGDVEYARVDSYDKESNTYKYVFTSSKPINFGKIDV